MAMKLSRQDDVHDKSAMRRQRTSSSRAGVALPPRPAHAMLPGVTCLPRHWRIAQRWSWLVRHRGPAHEPQRARCGAHRRLPGILCILAGGHEIQRQKFLESGKAIAIDVDESLRGEPRSFSSGSMGWYLGGKVEIEVAGQAIGSRWAATSSSQAATRGSVDGAAVPEVRMHPLKCSANVGSLETSDGGGGCRGAWSTAPLSFPLLPRASGVHGGAILGTSAQPRRVDDVIDRTLCRRRERDGAKLLNDCALCVVRCAAGPSPCTREFPTCAIMFCVALVVRNLKYILDLFFGIKAIPDTQLQYGARRRKPKTFLLWRPCDPALLIVCGQTL